MMTAVRVEVVLGGIVVGVVLLAALPWLTVKAINWWVGRRWRREDAPYGYLRRRDGA